MSTHAVDAESSQSGCYSGKNTGVVSADSGQMQRHFMRHQGYGYLDLVLMQGRCNQDPNARTVIVMITDSCPECEADHMDLQVYFSTPPDVMLR